MQMTTLAVASGSGIGSQSIDDPPPRPRRDAPHRLVGPLDERRLDVDPDDVRPHAPGVPAARAVAAADVDDRVLRPDLEARHRDLHRPLDPCRARSSALRPRRDGHRATPFSL